MLVFVSDLHIGDHTTGVQHLDFRAFAEALPNIGRQARENRSNQVTFVFLGDIFDLVRTREWTNLSAGRPWDTLPNADRNKPSPPPDAATCQNAEQLLRNIIEHSKNRDIFDVWSQPLRERYYYRDEREHSHLRPASFDPQSEEHLPENERSKRLWPCDVEPRRVFVPGNHDRMINQLPQLRQLVIDCLGLNIGREQPLCCETEFEHYFRDDDYLVWARHGQEWDSTNFEYADQWKPDVRTMQAWKFQEICIGEIIAAEIASRLPDELARQLKARGWDKADIRLAVENIQTLDDVRPMTAVLPWLINNIELNAPTDKQQVLHEALTGTIHAVAAHVKTLQFVPAWARRNGKIWHYRAIMFLAPRLKATTLHWLLQALTDSWPVHLWTALGKLYPCPSGAMPNDNYATAALQDLRRVQDSGLPQTLYVLYGHNHLADQVPLENTTRLNKLRGEPSPNVPDSHEKNRGCSVYLNTGTWRPLVRQALAQNGFMQWKNLTYSLFYCYQHDPGSKAARRPAGEGLVGDPTFEVWTGALHSPYRPKADALEEEKRAPIRLTPEEKEETRRADPLHELSSGKILPYSASSAGTGSSDVAVSVA